MSFPLKLFNKTVYVSNGGPDKPLKWPCALLLLMQRSPLTFRVSLPTVVSATWAVALTCSCHPSPWAAGKVAYVSWSDSVWLSHFIPRSLSFSFKNAQTVCPGLFAPAYSSGFKTVWITLLGSWLSYGVSIQRITEHLWKSKKHLYRHWSGII